MASIAHLLSPRYREAVVASSSDYLFLGPWGSHPLVDSLWSSGDLTFTHDGAQFTRLEKIEKIAEHPDLLRDLHVCWQERSAENCSRCEKCLRTMTALMILGRTDQSPCFDWSRYRLDSIAGLELAGDSVAFFRELEQAAADRGLRHVRDALRASLQRSRGRAGIARLAERLATLSGVGSASARLHRTVAQWLG